MAILLILIFSYFGFGLFILSKLKLKLSILEESTLAILLSISILSTLIAFAGQIFGVKSYHLLFLALLIGLTQYKKILSYFKALAVAIWRNKLGSTFLLLCVIIFSSTLMFSGVRSNGSMSLQEVHDSTWHISLIENLQKSIPPAHPSAPSIVLNNYHYFYDIFLAGLANFSNISLFVLYYQFSTIFLAVILLSSAYILGRKINGKLSGYYLVGFTAFAGSFAYLIPYFNPGQMWHESSFWVSQTLVMIVNPQIIYTLAVTYMFVFLLKEASSLFPKKSQYFALHGLLITLAATSIGFKSYAWVILTAIYGAFLLCELVRHKSLKTVAVGLLYLLISAPIVWLITKFKGNSFFYEPLWFTNSMIESPDRVNYLEWKFLQDHYAFKKNWIRFYIIEAKKIAIFYFGNLGIRSFFIGLPILIFFKKKKLSLSVAGYVFFGFLFSSIFPLLFLQRGTVWNSIQFWYYALIFANILVVILLSEVLKKKSKLTVTLTSIVLIALAIPTSIKTIQDKNRSPETINEEEISYLKSQDIENIILICPEGTGLYHSSLIKSLTPAEVYLANPSQLELVGSDQATQLEFEEIVDNTDSGKLMELISKNKITTVLCRDAGLTDRFSKMLKMKPSSIGSLNVFEF